MSFNVFDISASGLYAQRLRMDTVSSNLANINTTRNENGEPIPYVKKKVVFQTTFEDKLEKPSFPVGGVNPGFSATGNNMLLKGGIMYDDNKTANGVAVGQIEESKDRFKLVYEPDHPDANKDGFVKMPNINAVSEMIEMMSASRAYEANVSTIEAAKSMISSSLKI